MSNGSNWYQQEDGLLAALRTRPATTRTRPEIPGYGDLEEVSRGGQGVVYAATQTSTRRRVAIKVLLGGAFASLRDRRRFEREIDLVASLRHPAIVRLYDCGMTAEQYPYYVMEYLDGVGLNDLLAPAGDAAPQPFGPVGTTVQMFAKVCDAVGYAHRHAVIHRDLKPGNIHIDPQGEPHVLDFGLARASGQQYTADDSGIPVSMTGEFMGSLPWASPEQALGQPGRIDVRTDVYSLGVLLYQLLTGRFPYPVTGPFRDVLNNILEREPENIRQVRPEVDDELATIVGKCLDKDPDRRYQSAGDLARDLRHYLAGEPIEAKRDSAWYAISKRMRRYRLATRITSGFLAATLVAAIVMSLFWQRALIAESQANQARSAEAAARTEAERRATIATQINDVLKKILATPVEGGRQARVVDVLGPALAEIEQGGPRDPEIDIALRDTIGTAYAALGLYEEAEPLLVEANDRAVVHYGEGTDDALLVESHLAWLRYLQGNYDEAAERYRRILDTRLERFGESDPQAGVCMNDLALVLEQLGRWDEAEALYRRSLALAIEREGPDSADAINGIGNLSSVLHSMGQLEESESLARERLERARRVFGATHRDTLTAINNLAVLLNDLARYDEALALLRTAYDARVALLGPNHIETIRTAQNVAHTYGELGDFDEAERVFRAALAAMIESYGEEHPDTHSIRGNLAGILYSAGELDEALALQRQVYENRRSVLGAQHPDALRMLNNIATTQLTQLRYAEAVETLTTLAQQAPAAYGEDNPATLTILLNLASALRESGRIDEALPLARDVLAARRDLFGPDHPATFIAEWEILSGALESGRLAEALAGVTAMRERVGDVFGADHFYVPILAGYHGQILLVSGAYDEAEALLDGAADELTAMFGAGHFVTQAQLGRLCWLYELTGRADEARAMRDRLDDRQRRRLAHDRGKFERLGLPAEP